MKCWGPPKRTPSLWIRPHDTVGSQVIQVFYGTLLLKWTPMGFLRFDRVKGRIQDKPGSWGPATAPPPRSPNKDLKKIDMESNVLHLHAYCLKEHVAWNQIKHVSIMTATCNIGMFINMTCNIASPPHLRPFAGYLIPSSKLDMLVGNSLLPNGALALFIICEIASPINHGRKRLKWILILYIRRVLTLKRRAIIRFCLRYQITCL